MSLGIRGQLGGVCPFSYAVTSSVDRGSVAYGEEGPQTGDPLQFVLARCTPSRGAPLGWPAPKHESADLQRIRRCR